MDMVGSAIGIWLLSRRIFYASFRLASQVPVACLKVAEWNSCHGDSRRVTQIGIQRISDPGGHFMRKPQRGSGFKKFLSGICWLKFVAWRNLGMWREVAALQPDMLGFIFYKSSPRYAGDLSPRALERLPAAIGKVGVFVNEVPSLL